MRLISLCKFKGFVNLGEINFIYFPNKILILPNLYNLVSIIDDRDNYDYVYKLEELINFEKKHKQNLNYFLKNYNYQYKSITLNDKTNIEKIIVYFNEWYTNLIDKDDSSKLEYVAFNKMINYIDELDIKIGAIYVNDEIIGFCMGTIHDNVGYCHIEKANRKYKGSYQILIKEYCTYLSNQYNITEINREDDLGLLGLRKNKLSYKPSHFIEKSILILNM